MHKVKIIFKSGATQEIRCQNLKVKWTKDTNELTELAWSSAKPGILHINLNEVAGIFEL